MSRKAASAWEQEQKKQFDKAVKNNSIKALKNIIDIANNAKDMRIKLQANIFLVEKAIGKDYRAFENEIENREETRNVTIKLISQGKSYIPSKEDESDLKRIENNEMLCGDDTEMEQWDVDVNTDEDNEDWGSDVYNP